LCSLQLIKYFLPPNELDAVRLNHRFNSTLAKAAKPLNKSMSLKFIPATSDQKACWKSEESRPVVVLVSWLLAKAKHIQKHAEIYLKQGFDVITLEIRPFHLLFPAKGSQVQ
jgi:hypothetical protein